MESTSAGPDVLGLSEAAEILECRPAMVRAKLERLGISGAELAPGPVWARHAVLRAAAGQASRVVPVPVVGLREASEIIGVRIHNVRKWMAVRDLQPRELQLGPVWDRGAVVAAAKAWPRWKGHAAAA